MVLQVVPGGGDDVLRGVAGRAQHHVRVARQLLHDLLCLQVPDVHLGVCTNTEIQKHGNTEIQK